MLYSTVLVTLLLRACLGTPDPVTIRQKICLDSTCNNCFVDKKTGDEGYELADGVENCDMARTNAKTEVNANFEWDTCNECNTAECTALETFMGQGEVYFYGSCIEHTPEPTAEPVGLPTAGSIDAPTPQPTWTDISQFLPPTSEPTDASNKPTEQASITMRTKICLDNNCNNCFIDQKTGDPGVELPEGVEDCDAARTNARTEVNANFEWDKCHECNTAECTVMETMTGQGELYFYGSCKEHGGKMLSGYAIAGIVIGVVVVLGLLGLVAFAFGSNYCKGQSDKSGVQTYSTSQGQTRETHETV